MASLRVAMVSYHTSPLASLGSSSAGGMNVYVRRLAEGLAAREIEVDVFTRRSCIDCDREQEFTPGARLITVRAGPTKLISKNELAAHAPAFGANLARYIACRDLKYDVIHSHYWLSGVASQAIRSGQPQVHMFHTLSRVKEFYQPDAGQSDPAGRDYGERMILRSGETLVFSTEAEVDDVERLYGFRPQSVAIIPPGVDATTFAPLDREKSRQVLGLGSVPVILFVGRMDPAKGVELLLEASAMLQSNGARPFKVLIVGGDDHNKDAIAHRELDRLQSITSTLGLDNTVRFEGVVPQSTLPLYYASCDVCAVPSRYESFGMVALEALSSGRPVVGFDSPGLRQTIRHGRTGFLASSGSVPELADGLSRIISDPALARRMGLAAREASHRYSWDRVADETAELYGALAAESNAARRLRSS